LRQAGTSVASSKGRAHQGWRWRRSSTTRNIRWRLRRTIHRRRERCASATTAARPPESTTWCSSCRAAPVATPDGTIGAAGASTGAAGYVELYREPWDARIDVRSLTFELKAGTSDKESSPGTVVWDNFRAALARRLSVP